MSILALSTTGLSVICAHTYLDKNSQSSILQPISNIGMKEQCVKNYLLGPIQRY